MTPTQLQITLALRPGPLSYYDLMSAVDATEATVNKATLALLGDKQIEEVELGEVAGLRLVGGYITRSGAVSGVDTSSFREGEEISRNVMTTRNEC